MVIHTLVFSFAPDMTEEERDEFMRDMRDAMVDGAHAERFDWRPHLPLPADDHAPVFRASAVAEIRFADLDALRSAFAVPALGEAMGTWQRRRPYQVVWANHEPVT